MADDLRIARICMAIAAAQNEVGMQHAYTSASNLSDPHVPYYAANWYLMRNRADAAMPYLFESARMGIRLPNAFWNGKAADAVGSAIAFIFIHRKGGGDERSLSALATIGYGYLSKCIALLGVKAFDSYEHRARLMLRTQHLGHRINYGADGHQMATMLSEPFAIADFCDAAVGHWLTEDAEARRECVLRAKRCHKELEWVPVAGKNGDDYTLEEIAEVGRSRHKILSEKVISALEGGRVTLPIADFERLMEEVCSRK